MHLNKKIHYSLMLLFCLSNLILAAQIKLPALISDGVILQRDKELKIWGWANPAETIQLDFNGNTFSGKAQADSIWQITIPAQPAGGPHELHFSTLQNQSVTITDVLFGDVWICSGQSNMELNMWRLRDQYPEIVKTANNPNIRQFYVPRKYHFQTPQKDLSAGNWIAVSTETIYDFSGIAYFFATELHQKLNIPIGVINTALGGSPAQAWISEESLLQFPDYWYAAQMMKDDEYVSVLSQYNQANQKAWTDQLNLTDMGKKENWATTDIDQSDWLKITIPTRFKKINAEHKPGVIWLKKEIYLTEKQANQSSRLFLGRMIDADFTYFNGHFVGSTGYQYPPRKYDVKADWLKVGKNEISIRVIDESGGGGFKLDKPYCLIFNQDTLNLSGEWQYKVGTIAPPKPSNIFIRWQPLGLYNAMIAPLQKHAVKGVIWYQGESNTKYPDDYTALMTTLIKDWRAGWQEAELPFLFVQLANFMEASEQPQESDWAALRQAQLNTLKLPNTGMAVAIDLGEWNDIHPLKKEEVGQRLALQAFKKVYGYQTILASGPRVKAYDIEGSTVKVTFDEVGKGFKFNQNIKHFELAGADKQFVKAIAIANKNTISISCKEVLHPKYVRYAWSDNPEGVNLYNTADLPASPFELKLE